MSGTADVFVAVPNIVFHGFGGPTEFEGNLFERHASKGQNDSCSNTVGVAVDRHAMFSQVVCRIRVCGDDSGAHYRDDLRGT